MQNISVQCCLFSVAIVIAKVVWCSAALRSYDPLCMSLLIELKTDSCYVRSISSIEFSLILIADRNAAKIFFIVIIKQEK